MIRSFASPCEDSCDRWGTLPRLSRRQPISSHRLVSPKQACLIGDVHMPAMTGPELHRHLMEAGYAIPTILVTAYPDDDVRARALKDGVVCYFRKPVDENHLMRCLRAALQSGEPPEEKS